MNSVLNSMLDLLWWKNPAESWNCRSELRERPRLETYRLESDRLWLGEISQGKSMDRGEMRPRTAFTWEEHRTQISTRKTEKGWAKRKPREEGISGSIWVKQGGLQQYRPSWEKGTSGSSLSWGTCSEFDCGTLPAYMFMIDFRTVRSYTANFALVPFPFRWFCPLT